jgi:hypothetical protein
MFDQDQRVYAFAPVAPKLKPDLVHQLANQEKPQAPFAPFFQGRFYVWGWHNIGIERLTAVSYRHLDPGLNLLKFQVNIAFAFAAVSMFNDIAARFVYGHLKGVDRPFIKPRAYGKPLDKIADPGQIFIHAFDR